MPRIEASSIDANKSSKPALGSTTRESILALWVLTVGGIYYAPLAGIGLDALRFVRIYEAMAFLCFALALMSLNRRRDIQYAGVRSEKG